VPDEHGTKSRKLRNHIEHTDERLDKWLANGPRPFLTVEHVAHAEPDRPPEISAEIAAACVLTYDVASDVVTYIGESFSLAELEAQLHEVQDYIWARIERTHQGVALCDRLVRVAHLGRAR
jgi:hypothetical protein